MPRITLNHLGPAARRQAEEKLRADAARGRGAQQAAPAPSAGRNKYGARRVQHDGVWFDSTDEGRRYLELKALQQAGVIRDLRLQVPYELEVNGALICTYVADFVYELDGNSITEDVKSNPTKTPSYRIKRKLVQAIHGVSIVEVSMRDRGRPKVA